jgi:multidrug efflux system membrane fusion protein
VQLKNISTFKYWPQIAVFVLLILGFAAYRYFAYYDTRSSDAYVSAHVVNMAALVSGPITQIYVKENQPVKKGDKLIEIDPMPNEYALNQANYLPKYTTLVAPEDGYITNFNLRVGQYIKAGNGLFALIETKQWWVVTRYRETAIRLIKPGDKAKIMIDMYPGKVFHGHVESIGWGINRVQQGNAAPSTLLYLEATEDWIRIAQRFPVIIYIDDLTQNYPMRIGASATTITYR